MSCETHDTLHMPRAGEKVDRGDFADLVSLIREPFAVAGEGVGVAGNVDDASNAKRVEVAYKLLGSSLSGRVDDNDVGAEITEAILCRG